MTARASVVGRGARRAGDSQVELPTAVEVAVNRGAARAMGIALASAVLARANRVVD